jgi:5-(carboxyamino)imidazole ribonucleotide mutase
MKDAVKLLETWGVGVETQIVSAHRTPQLLEKSVRLWEERGVRVIIAGAGGAAHLPGMLASFSVLPVIGVPVWSKSLNGLDALLSVAQMPKGVPVATVAVNNAFNAGLLAAQILGSGDDVFSRGIRALVLKHKTSMAKQVAKDRKSLKKLGVTQFLKNAGQYGNK